MANLKITQRRSTIKRQQVQKRTMEALGLKRIGQTVVQQDTPQLRGMIERVKHLVDIAEADAGEQTSAQTKAARRAKAEVPATTAPVDSPAALAGDAEPTEPVA